MVSNGAGDKTNGAAEKDEVKTPYHARFLARILRSSQFTVGADGNQKTNLTPVLLEARKYQNIFSEERSSSVPDVPDWELLHSIVGLYDNYLPEITPEVLYSTLTSRSSITLVFLRDPADVLKERENEKEGKRKPKKGKKEKLEKQTENEEGEEDRTFTGVFSDEESDSESESSDEGSDDEDNEHYAAGLDEYLENVEKRRNLREENKNSIASVGVESLLVAAATFKRVHDNEENLRRDREKIIQLTLLAVRKKFRKLGIGRQLLNFLRNPIVVGEYDALVSYVDPGATVFFLRNGFSSDAILNNRFRDLVDHWDNSTLMSYLPPYSECLSTGTASLVKEMSSSLSDDIKRWRSASVDAYQSQLRCLERMRHEIMLLRTTVGTQETTINSLTMEIDRQANSFPHTLALKALMARQVGEEEYRTIEDEFRAEVCKVPSYHTIRISIIEKPNPKKANQLVTSFNVRCNALRDPNLRTRLYYCGGKAGTLHRILREGFQPKDMVAGDYGQPEMKWVLGQARYVMRLPGLLLLCEVGIGMAESVLKMDKSRNRPPVGYDSVLTGDRNVDHVGIYSHQRHNELQYLIFDSTQVKSRLFTTLQ
eukprot:sb/3463235/